MKGITVSVDTGCFAYLDEFVDFQGDLKEISEESLSKLKSRIIYMGFAVPFFVWKDGEVLNILDGHQRKLALLSLKAEGWNVPKLPYVEIPAASEAEAREKLLAISSQYGDFNVSTLKEWMDELNSDYSDTLRFVSEEITFNLDMDLGFGDDNEEEEQEVQKCKTCPNCGHEW